MLIHHEQIWRIPGDEPDAEAVLRGIEEAWSALGYETRLIRNGQTWMLTARIAIPWGGGKDADQA